MNPSSTPLRGVIKTGSSLSNKPPISDTSMSTESDEMDGPKAMRRCSFSCVDIREHERIAGDNPCVSSGVPLSIGWGYHQHQSLALDNYELNKGPPRDKIEMLVPAEVRKSMLRDEFGVSVKEINMAVREANITRLQRRNTVSSEHLDVTDAVRIAKRTFFRVVKKKTSVNEQEKLCQEYLKTRGKSP